MNTHYASRADDTTDFNQQVTNRLTATIQNHPHPADTRSVAAAVASNLWANGSNDAPSGVTDVIEDVIRAVDPNRSLPPAQLAAAIWGDIATSAAPSFRIF